MKPVVAIEIGLNYGRHHLESDAAKLANSALAQSYVVHLARNPAFHHPSVVDQLIGSGTRVAAAFAGSSTRTYRLLETKDR